jgi:hypothetical protein
MKASRKRFTLHKLHHQIRYAVLLTNVVERADVRVIQRRSDARLARKALTKIRPVGHLRAHQPQGNLSAEPGVHGTVDLAHTPLPD